jgi:preprotein translocase subunit SecB
MIAFRLKETRVLDLSVKERIDNGDFQEDLRYRPVFEGSQPNQFGVLFDLHAQISESHHLEVEYLGLFETQEAITQDFRQSHFPIVNAPAVVYPYLRALVSQISLLCGHQPYTLSIRNFVNAAKSSGPVAADTAVIPYTSQALPASPPPKSNEGPTSPAPAP